MTLEERFEKVYAILPRTERNYPICFIKINKKDYAFSWKDIYFIIKCKTYRSNTREKILERLVILDVI